MMIVAPSPQPFSDIMPPLMCDFHTFLALIIIWTFKFGATPHQTLKPVNLTLVVWGLRSVESKKVSFVSSLWSGLVWRRVHRCNAVSVSGGLAGLLTALLWEFRESRELYLMSSYVSFSCAGFTLPLRKCSLANVLLCTPTRRRRWKTRCCQSAHMYSSTSTHTKWT